jgi:hypothetical protein
MWGRGLRSSPDTGKRDCLLLDHSGNITRFVDDYTEVFFNGLAALDAAEKLDRTIRKEPREKETMACPSCGFCPYTKRCIACGFEARSGALVEVLPGKMQEVSVGRTKLANDKRHLYAQLCTYARYHSMPSRQAARAAHLFRDITGMWPPRDYVFRDTHNVEIERETLNKIQSLNIAYSRRRSDG